MASVGVADASPSPTGTQQPSSSPVNTTADASVAKMVLELRAELSSLGFDLGPTPTVPSSGTSVAAEPEQATANTMSERAEQQL